MQIMCCPGLKEGSNRLPSHCNDCPHKELHEQTENCVKESPICPKCEWCVV